MGTSHHPGKHPLVHGFPAQGHDITARACRGRFRGRRCRVKARSWHVRVLNYGNWHMVMHGNDVRHRHMIKPVRRVLSPDDS